MTLLTYVRSDTDAPPMFAVIADDDGADYHFPLEVEPWLDKERVEQLAAMMPEPPTDAAGWMDVATANLGVDVAIDDPVEVQDDNAAAEQADTELANFTPREPESALSDAASEAYDQVTQDYPGFLEDDDTTTPEAMTNFVMMMLGPIDPDGPNGWLLRAQDGDPAPGDENEYVHFPGELPADGEPDEAAPEAPSEPDPAAADQETPVEDQTEGPQGEVTEK